MLNRILLARGGRGRFLFLWDKKQVVTMGKQIYNKKLILFESKTGVLGYCKICYL